MRTHGPRLGQGWSWVLAVVLGLMACEYQTGARAWGQVTKRRPAAGPDRRPKADWPPQTGFSIHSARLGTRERWLDISRAVQARVADNTLAGLPEGLPDPAPGLAKAVVIVYSLDGKVGLSVTPADQPLSLPPAEPADLVPVPEVGLVVLAARLGDADHWQDVTAEVQKRVIKDRLELAYPAAEQLPGYQADQRQALALLYSRRGRVRFWLRRDDRPVSLPEFKPEPGETADLQHPTQDDLDYLKHLSPVFQELDTPAELEQIKDLDLAGLTLDNLGLVHLRGLMRLRSLSLAETRIDDDGLEEIAGLGRLRALNLSGTSLTDAALKALPNFNGLMAIWLNKTHVTNAGMPVFEQLVNLELLSLAETEVMDEGLAGLRKLRGLKSLDLSKRPGQPSAAGITDNGLSALRSLASLEKLNLAGTAVNGSGLVQMRGIRLLKQLDLSRTQFADDSIKWLLASGALTSLKVGSTKVTDAGLATLLDIKQLAELDVQDTAAGNNFLDALGKRAKDSETGLSLSSLNLTKTEVTDSGLKALNLVPSLQHLYLGETEIRGTGLTELLDLVKLRTLDLHQTRITDAALRYLRPMENLDNLNLANTKVTNAAIAHIKRLRQLTKLDIRGTDISPAGVNELRAALPKAEIIEDSK